MKLPKKSPSSALLLLTALLSVSGCGPRPSVLTSDLGPNSGDRKTDSNEGVSVGNPGESDPSLSEEDPSEILVGKKIADETPNREMSRKELAGLARKYREEELSKRSDERSTEDGRKPTWPTESANPTELPTLPSTPPILPPVGPQVKPSERPTAQWPYFPLPTTPTAQKPTAPAKNPPVKPTKPTPTKPVPTKPAPSKNEGKTSTWPKVPTKPTTPPPPKNSGADDGVDAEDEKDSDDYNGPKEAIFRPQSTSRFNLSESAAALALLPKKTYLRKQREIVETRYPACNFFVITSLHEAKIVDEDHLPMFTAGAFGRNYFIPKGWKRIDIATATQWMREGQSFDIVIQKNPPRGKRYGHIAIPIGLNAKGDTLVAEGVLGRVTNRIRVFTRREISKYNIYVRY